MSVSLDLRKAHKNQRHGDIIAVLTWVNDERALVLLPALRKQAGWYIVQDSAAYRWGVDHPNPDIRRPAQEHAMVQSHIACSMLGIEPTRANRARIISIVTGWIPDLVSMPSAPEATFLKGSFGEIALSVDGKKIAAQDVQIEDKGASYG
jgi:hypothetical protein